MGFFIPGLAVIFQEAGYFSVMLNSALLIRHKEKFLSPILQVRDGPMAHDFGFQ